MLNNSKTLSKMKSFLLESTKDSNVESMKLNPSVKLGETNKSHLSDGYQNESNEIVLDITLFGSS